VCGVCVCGVCVGVCVWCVCVWCVCGCVGVCVCGWVCVYVIQHYQSLSKNPESTCKVPQTPLCKTDPTKFQFKNKYTSCFFERFIGKKVCTASYKTVALTNLNKYLYNGKSEIGVNINNNNEKL